MWYSCISLISETHKIDKIKSKYFKVLGIWRIKGTGLWHKNWYDIQIWHILPTFSRFFPILTFSSQKYVPTFLIGIPVVIYTLVGSTRLRESNIQRISPKTPAPQYQPMDRKKRKRKMLGDYSKDRAAWPIQKHWPCSWKPPVPHYRMLSQQDRSRGTLRGE